MPATKIIKISNFIYLLYIEINNFLKKYKIFSKDKS